ncbi:MAG TPA: hypothetical protein VFQ44_14200 [Streptosporangiaceae bacterium]|nr:hypothetical protein [Streptosporangiaceae bacterium]
MPTTSLSASATGLTDSPARLPLPRRPARPARPLPAADPQGGRKTVTRLVPDDQLDDYRQWLDNHRPLRALAADLEALTLTIADAGTRTIRRAAPIAPTPRKQPHNTVDTTRLSRGQHSGQHPFSQVTAKCEDLTRSEVV